MMRMMRKGSLLFTALAVCAVGALQASASLVLNGSFEAPTTAVFTTVPNGTAPGTIPSWGVGLPGSGVPMTTGAGVDVVLAGGGGGALPSPASDGSQYIDLTGTLWTGDPNASNQNGNIYQTISTVANQWYKLTFDHASPEPGGKTGAYSIWDGDWTSIIPVPGGYIDFGTFSDPGSNPLNWLTSSVLFQAQSASTTIVFGAIFPDSGNSGHLLDNVAVVAVPEPATFVVWTLLGLATAGVSYKRARKNAAVR